MVAQNALLEKMGYPIIEQKEHEDVLATFSALEDPDSFSNSALATFAAPSSRSVMATVADTSPEKELKNVYYVNFNPKTDTMSPELRKQLMGVKENVDLSGTFIDNKANAAVAAKVASKELEDEETPKANYLAKVTNHLTSNAPWMAGFGIKTLHKEFRVEKNLFHQTLVSTFTQGLNLPASINEQLEGILTNINNTVNLSNDDKPKENLMFFILMTIYQKDDVLQAWQPYLRTVYFRVDQSLSTYTKSKHDTSSGFKVEVDIEYVQTDGAFNDKLFADKAKDAINKLVGGKVDDFVNGKTDDVPV